jgi:hypothetical protein
MIRILKKLTVLLEKQTVAQLVKRFPVVMVTKGSLRGSNLKIKTRDFLKS